MTTQKAYVTNVKRQPQETTTRMVVEFDPRPESAAVWNTRERAQNACREFESFAVRVPARADAVCKGFEVEERARYQFAVFCEYPSSRVTTDVLEVENPAHIES
jgi:hypothetical protein